jgi:hypothetical protein
LEPLHRLVPFQGALMFLLDPERLVGASVEADGRTYEFRRASMWRQEEELHSEGLRVGSVKRTSLWRGDVVAELPGLPLPVQIFVLAVVLTMWDAQSAAASTAVAG